MNVVFRTDASLNIGTGHVMRCLNLAHAIASVKDAKILFVSREYVGNLCDLIVSQGFKVAKLPKKTQVYQKHTLACDYSTWLGASWEEDAAQTKKLIEKENIFPDWVVVDHYAIDEKWEKSLRSSSRQIMVIDDLANRTHDCDLILDQNLIVNMRTRYTGKIPKNCKGFFGPKYALLNAIYSKLHDCTPPRLGMIQRILIFFGGTDNNNLTGRILKCFIDLKRSDIKVDVVIAEGYPYKHKIYDIANKFDNIIVYEYVSSLAPLIIRADLAIGASGAVSWERLCLGLPSVIITLADNQIPIAEELHRRGLVILLGTHKQFEKKNMIKVLETLLNNPLRKNWSEECSKLVKGRGAEIIITKMLHISENLNRASL